MILNIFIENQGDEYDFQTSSFLSKAQTDSLVNIEFHNCHFSQKPSIDEPFSINELMFTNCSNLKIIKLSQSYCQKLSINGCESLERIELKKDEKTSCKLQELTIKDLNAISKLFENIDYDNLRIENCNFANFQGNFSKDLKKLTIKNCESLIILNNLPPSITSLEIENCINLSLVSIPNSINNLSITNCEELVVLKGLSDNQSLNNFNLNNSPNLDLTELEYSTLKLLESKGCKLTFPNESYPKTYQDKIRQEAERNPGVSIVPSDISHSTKKTKYS
jgi:hypothetical protein